MQANLSILIVGIFPFKMNLVIFELNYNMFLLNASGYCHIGILSISRVFSILSFGKLLKGNLAKYQHFNKIPVLSNALKYRTRNIIASPKI
ncbi:uncharacterized protein NEPG_01596 [Nematocida parisii ERTm1]|uniref:uncharacterized protein n=1 Tax=Nematocida parisii (strain ERTm1 / ATCC PRA-289) TaxID=881290 RepID=UPI000264B2D6|nr:uncharacterized protein NEPG_01596 [Nematocida parisii ERTm1]EIJ93254.1 hypothetical protein NEPG_01596 [Nematocida parisii ERTm1]|eukprot:XP_013059424.1 hypothetical protein NEPG_01596 [Nematocida parisii ERTm1]